MPIAPNTDNYTTGAMPKLFFTRTGESEIELGCISAASIEPLLEFLDHFCAQSGSRTKDKSVVIEKGLQITFNWDEINADNMRNFLFGDALTDIGQTADTLVVDEEHIVPAEGLVKLINEDIEAAPAIIAHLRHDQFVHFDDSATLYTDFTTQLQKTAGDTGGTILDQGGTPGDASTDILYVGHSTKWNRFKADIKTIAVLAGANLMLKFGLVGHGLLLPILMLLLNSLLMVRILILIIQLLLLLIGFSQQ